MATGQPIDDWEYLIHHVETNENGKESIHHCFLYDHLGNMFVQKHIAVSKGKVYVDGRALKDETYHVLVGLESTQDVSWSDEQAKESGIIE